MILLDKPLGEMHPSSVPLNISADSPDATQLFLGRPFQLQKDKNYADGVGLSLDGPRYTLS